MNFYIVVEGAPIVTVLAADGTVEVERRLGPGDTFGEVALLANTPRSASVKAGSETVRCGGTAAPNSPVRRELPLSCVLLFADAVRLRPQVKCWVLGRTTFRNVLSDSAFKRRRRFGELLDKIKILSGLTCAADSHPVALRLD